MSKKILIIDDEQAACRNLSKKILALFPDLKIKMEPNPVNALTEIENWEPDIVFLDVQMPTLDGFSLLNQIPMKRRNFSLIFCTAYSEYAVKAFEESATDYLLKPVEPERLNQALTKALKFPTLASSKKMDQLASQSFLSRLYIKTRGQSILIDTKDINYFFSDAHETIVKTNGKEYICDLSLTTLAQKLDPSQFFRCHRSTIVNLGQVLGFNSSKGEIEFKGSSEKVLVSKRSRAEILKRLKTAT